MKVAVFTIKGGVGKTAIILGIGLAASLIYNKKVLLVDTDLQADLSYRILGDAVALYSVFSNEKYGIAKFASIPNAEPKPVQLFDNLYLIPMEHDAFMNVDQQTIMRKISDLPDDYDLILIDTPPSFDRNSALELISNVDAIFTVVAPAYPSIRITNAELRFIIPMIIEKVRNTPYFVGIIKNNIYSTVSEQIQSAIFSLNDICTGEMRKVPHYTPCIFSNEVKRKAAIFNYNRFAYNIRTKNTKTIKIDLAATNIAGVTEEFLKRLEEGVKHE